MNPSRDMLLVKHRSIRTLNLTDNDSEGACLGGSYFFVHSSNVLNSSTTQGLGKKGNIGF